MVQDSAAMLTALRLFLRRRPRPRMYVGIPAVGASRVRLGLATSVLQRICAVAFVASESDRRTLAGAGFPVDRVIVRREAIDTDFFSPLADHKIVDIQVGSAGREHRDYRTLAEACALIGVDARVCAVSSLVRRQRIRRPANAAASRVSCSKTWTCTPIATSSVRAQWSLFRCLRTTCRPG